MNRAQFIIVAVFTAIETYFFNESMMTENYLLAGFFAFLILRNLRMSYVMGKVLDEIEKQIHHKK